MNKKKRNALGRLPLDPLLSRQQSIVVIDPKSELAAVMRGTAKTNGGVRVIDPFAVLPPEQAERSGKWFRLAVGSANSDFQRKEAKIRGTKRSER
jgi:hypothetical protein